MSPQQVSILPFDAINLAKTMRVSFKTAAGPGYPSRLTSPPSPAASWYRIL
jgi:hypothetical protein